MANEYLKRTPTSTGNRKVFTWSSWLKKDEINSPARLFANYSAGTTQSAIQFGYRNGASTDGAIRLFNIISGTTDALFEFNPLFRDYSSWFHLLLSVNTTLGNADDRIIFYINGVRQKPFTSTYVASGQNSEFSFNTPLSTNSPPAIGSSGSSEYWEGEICDVFWVDGQALTPEVFGFYKDGNGYISAGSTQATDFRNGQWVPRTPREIKNLINDNGGFGVNGFYLPMNDSSNFGADFHTTPNSIITLKGENLPQPRNGAPDTTDAYVNQLRSDPYAANLVLAVPGISTATGANLITNGTFESDISGWTASGVQFTHTYNSVGGNTSGKLMYFATGADTTRNIYQNVTTEVGKRYTLSFDASSDTASANTVQIDTTDVVTVTDNNNSAFVHHNVSFTATSTSTQIRIISTVSNRSYFDNFVVKQEDAPLDYSADIKGSGTNKTLTANGNAGVGYEIPSYYGSALSFDGTGDYFQLTDNGDFNASGDFTIEFWANLSLNDANAWLFSKWNSGSNQREYTINVTSGGRVDFYWSTDGTTHGSLQTPAGVISADQWNHYVWEKNGSVLTGYINGVAVVVKTDLTSQYHNSSNPLYIGSLSGSQSFDGQMQDLRVYKGIAKYKGGFDVPKPYTPVGIESFRAVPDTCKNNFATMNPLIDARPSSGTSSPVNSTLITFADGNLKLTNDASSGNSQRMMAFSSVGFSTGKWYYEEITGSNGRLCLTKGVQQLLYSGIAGSGAGVEALVRINASDGVISVASTAYYSTATPSNLTAESFDNTNVMGVAVDASLGKNNLTVQFYKDGVGIATLTGIGATSPVEEWFPTKLPRSSGSADEAYFNFGQNPTFSGRVTAGTYTDANGRGLFKYEPPSGHLALCEDNLPTPEIKDPGEHFKAVLYTGDGAKRNVTKVGFQPDLVWLKQRNGTAYHAVFDSVRGPGRQLHTNVTNTEGDGLQLTGFNSDGFSLSSSSNTYNGDGQEYVAWCWKAGGPAVTNTDGSITSQVSANQDAGFSIVTWIGNATEGATIGHGLGKAPSFIIVKNRDDSGSSGSTNGNWQVWHKSFTAQQYIMLNSTNGAETETGGVTPWGETLPSSSVISLGSFNSTNGSGDDFVAYCWSEIEGYSKMGTYIGGGNTTDSNFVYCGFKPAWVMVKNIEGSGDKAWAIYDSSRDPDNVCVADLSANHEYVEGHKSYNGMDFLSNGFKIRAYANWLSLGNKHIFIAFAESPFQTANAK